MTWWRTEETGWTITCTRNTSTRQTTTECLKTIRIYNSTSIKVLQVQEAEDETKPTYSKVAVASSQASPTHSTWMTVRTSKQSSSRKKERVTISTISSDTTISTRKSNTLQSQLTMSSTPTAPLMTSASPLPRKKIPGDRNRGEGPRSSSSSRRSHPSASPPAK
jgi:hypothetical protein